MAKKILLLFIFITTLIYAETKPSTDVFEYRLKQLENKYITIEIQNEMLIEQKIKLESKIDILENKNKENVEVYKKLLENNENLYYKQLTTFQLILFVVGGLIAIITFFGFREIKKGIDKKVEEKIDSKSNEKIKEFEDIIKDSKNLLKESTNLKNALTDKMLTYEDILIDYKAVLEELKNKSPETFTDEDKRKIDLITKDIQNKKDKTDEDWFFIGLEHQDNEQDDKAIDAYKKSIEINPNNSSAHNNYGAVLAKKELYNDAIDAYKNAIRINSSYDIAHHNLGLAYCNLKEFTKGIESFKKAIKINPKHSNAHYNLGIAYTNKELYVDAIESFKNDLKINPENDKSYTNMGTVYGKKEQYKDAIQSFKRSLDISPNKASSYTNLGLAYMHLEEYDNAINSYKKSLSIDDTNNNTYNNLGLAYGRKEQYSDAIEIYKKSLVLNPDNINVYINLIEISLVSNTAIDKNVITTYTQKFTEKDDLIIFDMLKLFESIKNDKEYKENLNSWESTYSNTELNWGFIELETWINKEENPIIKQNLEAALDIFKKYQNKFQENQK